MESIEFESMRKEHPCLEKLEVTSESGESIYLCSYCHIPFATLAEIRNHVTKASHLRMQCICSEIMKGGWPFIDGSLFHSRCDVMVEDKRVGFVELKQSGNGVVKGRYRDQWLLSCWMQYETMSHHHLQHLQQEQVERPFGIVTFRNFRDIIDAQKHPMLNAPFCNICFNNLLPSKDASTVIQLEEKKFFCAAESQKVHVFHTSCLILWILYHEQECEEEHSPPPLCCPKCYSEEKSSSLKLMKKMRELFWMERDREEPALGLRIRSNIPKLQQPPEDKIRDIGLIPFYTCESLRK